MPRKGGASAFIKVSRSRRKKIWLDANKRRSRNVKLSGRNIHKR